MATAKYIDNNVASVGDGKWWKDITGGGGGLAGFATALAGSLAAGTIAGAASGNTGKENILSGNVEISNEVPNSGAEYTKPDEELPDIEVPGQNNTATGLPAVKDTGNINTGKTAVNKDDETTSLKNAIIAGKPTSGTSNNNPPDIPDATDENVEMAIGNTDMLDMLKSLRDEQWAREDAIREHVEAREDSAYSRAISDMRRAGVNVNLVGAQPAASGGGITNATGVDLGMLEQALNNEGNALVALLNNEFKGDENTKDRIMQGITSALSLTGQMVLAYLLKGKK